MLENPFRDYHIREYTMRCGILKFDDPEDMFVVTGRGVAYSSSKWKLPKGMWEPWDLGGSQVKINGIEVKVLGVDAFASPRSPASPYNHSFAILVSEEDAERIPYEPHRSGNRPSSE